MGIFGQNFGAGQGAPDNHIKDLIYKDRKLSLLVAEGFGGQYYGIYLNNRLLR